MGIPGGEQQDRPRTARPLAGTDVVLAHASAQVGSAVLLAGLNATGKTTVHYPGPVRDHTERMLADMGAPVSWDAASSSVDGPVSHLRAPGDGALDVPGDLSGAAFLLAAAVLVTGSRVRIDHVGINPGRTGILDVLARMRADVHVAEAATAGREPTATLVVGEARRARVGGRASGREGVVSGRSQIARPDGGVSAGNVCSGEDDRHLPGVEVAGALVPRTIDELPLVAVLACAAHGRTVVRDAAELRVKESDRIAAIVDGLARMGARIEARGDGFVVDGPCRLHGATVEGRGDHRIVMALAVAALAADGETVISDAERVGDSFPGFDAVLAGLGADVRLLGRSR